MASFLLETLISISSFAFFFSSFSIFSLYPGFLRYLARLILPLVLFLIFSSVLRALGMWYFFCLLFGCLGEWAVQVLTIISYIWLCISSTSLSASVSSQLILERSLLIESQSLLFRFTESKGESLLTCFSGGIFVNSLYSRLHQTISWSPS